jgi:hypothetical protein
MSVGLLAKYAETNRLKVWLHLRPGPFKRITPESLRRYAEAFGIPASELTSVPDTHVSRSGNR